MTGKEATGVALIIKTIKIGIHKEMNSGKRQAILDTQALYEERDRSLHDDHRTDYGSG